MKEEAWHRLADNFNEQSSCGITRSADQLKALWNGTKITINKKIASDKVSAYLQLKLFTIYLQVTYLQLKSVYNNSLPLAITSAENI